MARLTKPLTDREIKEAKPKAKDYSLSDGSGLYLLITNRKTKLWRFNYLFETKRYLLSLGTYPSTTLLQARKQRDELKIQIAKGINPSQKKKDDKEAKKIIEAISENTFFNVSQNWLKSYESEVSSSYHTKLSRALTNYIYPLYEYNGAKVSIKDKPINEITRKNIIAILEQLKENISQETAKRTAMLLQKIYRYAVTHELTPHNIIFDIDMKVVIGKSQEVHYPTFSKDDDIRGLLQAIDGYNGDYSTKMALRALPYLFVRSSNMRMMEWSEINLQTKEWIIPAHKMKTKIEFTLPLPPQAIEIIKEVQSNKLSDKFVFASGVYKDRAISDNTLNGALNRLGYKGVFNPHSFRAMFSTVANTYANDPQKGHGYTSEVIEALLAHKEPNKVKEAYNRSTYKEAMRGLIEWYGDYLDGVKNG